MIETKLRIKTEKGYDVDNINRSNPILEVDGVLYKHESSSYKIEEFMYTFKNLKYDDVKNAKNINIIYTVLDSSIVQDDTNTSIEVINEEGIEYPKKIVSNRGLIYEFYNIEKEENKMKI